MVGSAETKYQSCSGILHRLKAADKVDRHKTPQRAFSDQFFLVKRVSINTYQSVDVLVSLIVPWHVRSRTVYRCHGDH